MGQVVVAIAGRTYRMNCEDGQEPHLETLAREVDERMTELKRNFGEIGDQRLAVMAALTIVDDLDGARRTIETQATDAAAAVAAHDTLRHEKAARIADLEAALERAAARIERIAGSLNAAKV
jgi:cell division protein ZapA